MADDLAAQQRRAMAELDKQLTDITRSIVLTAFREIVEASPVDTGWSRANWIPAIGDAPATPVGTRDAFSLGEQAAGFAAVAGYRSIKEGPLALANSVPYIVYLNAGSSSQAPAMYIESAVERAVAMVTAFGMDQLDSAVAAAAAFL